MLERYSIQILLGSVIFFTLMRYHGRKRNVTGTVGYSSPILSYISAFRFFWAGREIIEEGYRKYPNQIWKFPTLKEWFIIANGTQKLEEISKACDEQLSNLDHASSVIFQLDHTLGRGVTTNPYHVNVVRAAMTRNIVACFDEMLEETMLAFEDAIPSISTLHEWVAVPTFHTTVEVMSKIGTRLFVGRPLCDNKAFRRICAQSGKHILEGKMLNHFPNFLRPVASRLFLSVHSEMKKLLHPLVNYRLEQERLHSSSWPGKPNDLLTWMVDEAMRSGGEVTSHEMAVRIYFLSFALFATSTMFTYALNEIATRTEYLQLLRPEIETIIDQEGWTKGSISKMYKLDSFLREVHRCYDLQLLHMGRTVLQDFTFSDGTMIPTGSTLFVNSWGTHHDDNLYPSAYDFQGFRFVNVEDSFIQRSLAKPSPDYNAFGYGKHACPGRFFAATRLKSMLAYVITTYHIKNEIEGIRPANTWIESTVYPDTNAKILFKKRSKSQC